MKYRYEYEVKYQEVDDRKRLRLYNLESYLLEVAGRVADDLGFGIQVLHPRGLTWILTRLSVEMAYLPTHNERLQAEKAERAREAVRLMALGMDYGEIASELGVRESTVRHLIREVREEGGVIHGKKKK